MMTTLWTLTTSWPCSGMNNKEGLTAPKKRAETMKHCLTTEAPREWEKAVRALALRILRLSSTKSVHPACLHSTPSRMLRTRTGYSSPGKPWARMPKMRQVGLLGDVAEREDGRDRHLYGKGSAWSHTFQCLGAMTLPTPRIPCSSPRRFQPCFHLAPAALG